MKINLSANKGPFGGLAAKIWNMAVNVKWENHWIKWYWIVAYIMLVFFISLHELFLFWSLKHFECLFNLVNGGWSHFGSYSQCSVSCGGGNHTRSRTCTNPTPQHGGKNCVGSSTETHSCNNDPCPSKFNIQMFIIVFRRRI